MIDQTQINSLERKVAQLINGWRSEKNKNEKLLKEINALDEKLAETTRELDLLRENTHLITTVQEQNEAFRKQRDALRTILQRLTRRVSALSKAIED